ncbi:UBX domain-containing protein 11-like [Liolophura sinensis]|uniref:UBX domain-containing protein 11-like n=1 Tax=Liolophura sinensis TaxID=3198878 RepID=UPI003158D788
MSSPLSSLKKNHKSALGLGHLAMGSNDVKKPLVPFRPGYTDDEHKLLDEITSSMASSRPRGMRDPFLGGLPKPSDASSGRSNVSRGSNSNSVQTSPRSTTSTKTSDHELMSIMMARLAQLEQKVQYQTKDICDKDKKIRILEDKVKILNKARESDSPGKTQHLEKKCLLLQQQIHEMEQFLADYGMVWVGESADDDSDVYQADSDEDDTQSTKSNQGIWRPGASVPTTELKVDYNQLIKNVQELNVLAGEGVARVQRTTDGARLKIPDSVPLVLYANGIVLFAGPFRPFTDPATQQCVKDLMDGYFPTELQNRYPEGIPLQITDKREVFFRDKRNDDVFKGSGQLLGGETKPSRLIPSNLNLGTQTASAENTQGLVEETELPGPKQSVDQFLGSLPSSVIRGGRVIDIRESLRQDIQPSSAANDVTVVETQVVMDMKKRLEIDQKKRPPTPRNITTLRIKAETGEKTFVLKMKFTDTVADLRRYLDTHRLPGSPAYDIMSTFPSRILEDDTVSLQSCGLTPNATLHLRVRKGTMLAGGKSLE